MPSKDTRCTCKSHSVRATKRGAWPMVLGVAVALLPKCPFCILAWSSAITLCSGEQIYDHSAEWTSWISVGLVALTFGLVVWNYRGSRTVVAAALVLLGGGLVVRAEWLTGSLATYYCGAVLLLAGVWINGNLLPLMRQWGVLVAENGNRVTQKQM